MFSSRGGVFFLRVKDPWFISQLEAHMCVVFESERSMDHLSARSTYLCSFWEWKIHGSFLSSKHTFVFFLRVKDQWFISQLEAHICVLFESERSIVHFSARSTYVCCFWEWKISGSFLSSNHIFVFFLRVKDQWFISQLEAQICFLFERERSVVHFSSRSTYLCYVWEWKIHGSFLSSKRICVFFTVRLCMLHIISL